MNDAPPPDRSHRPTDDIVVPTLARSILDRKKEMSRWLTGSALIPLARQGGVPGKEIRYPVATTIIGGLIAGA